VTRTQPQTSTPKPKPKPPNRPSPGQERVAAQEKRDGHLSKEQRLERMQQVIGHCGADNKQCMREMLGQAEGATDEDAVRF
jgi:hypothetical protein